MTFPVFPGSNPSGYNLTRSLRFRASASAYLNKTFSTSGTGAGKTWTFSAWVKRGVLGSASGVFDAYNTSGPSTDSIGFRSDDTFTIYFANAGGGNLTTTQVFRDPSAWYHIVIALDTTQATASNRCKIYVNGSQVTAFGTANYPSQNAIFNWGNTQANNIGRKASAVEYFDGYLTEINFIDGQALTPSSFGSTNTLTGVWQPARYGGTYGTNGFYLPFTDNSALTTSSNVGLGKDFSGNGNYWVTNNISLAPGSRQSFTTVGTTTWTAPAGVTSVQYLVVAGGGAGGGGVGAYFGGGGAGGLLTGSATVTPGNTYSITVGAGGVGISGTGTNGGNSSFDSFATATGGGFGGTFYTTVGNGGSGGGGFFNGGSAGTGIAGQGYAGGTTGLLDRGGGGGGAGGAGAAYAAGVGVSSSITGSAVTYATGGTGGLVVFDPSSGGNGTANRGNGGGGASGSGSGGNGGSGIVVIAWGGDSTYDSMTDVPTLTSATAANFAVVNPLANVGGLPISAGNLNVTGNGSAGGTYGRTVGTMAVSSGKWYWEYVLNSTNGYYLLCGIALSSEFTGNYVGSTATSYGYYGGTGVKYNNGSSAAYGAAYGVNDIIGVALDLDAGTLTFYKNNVSQGTAYSGLSGSYVPAFSFDTGAMTGGYSVNFGQRPFAYTPPTGYVALNTYNLPTSTIVKGNTVMDATLWTGDGTSPRTITNASGFKPDLVWFKSRSTTYYHQLADSVRGATKSIYSNVTNAEENNAINGYLSSINSNGFSVINGSSSGGSVNANGTTYVAWQWQAGQGTTSTNTSGTISATVSVNASAGFSVVTYTGNGSAGATLGHGLGVAPSLIFIKSLSATGYWIVYSSVNGATKYLTLNTTDAVLTNAGPFNNTAPTSSVFSVGNSADVNSNGTTYVAYCWTPIAGYSAMGSYSGNGSTDGPFVYTGFRPKFVMIKRYDVGAPWLMLDSSRNTYNVVNNYLLANASDAEASGSSPNDIDDFLSNGFKIRCSNAGQNASGGGYIYMAFAENPFKNALAR